MSAQIDLTYGWSFYEQSGNKTAHQCRIRVFSPHPEQQVVMASEFSHREVQSASQMITALATRVVYELQLNPALLSWIEHYPIDAVDYSLIEFDWSSGVAWFPRWSSLQTHEVEIMIGQKL
jgi:hypothetical protein